MLCKGSGAVRDKVLSWCPFTNSCIDQLREGVIVGSQLSNPNENLDKESHRMPHARASVCNRADKQSAEQVY